MRVATWMDGRTASDVYTRLSKRECRPATSSRIATRLIERLSEALPTMAFSATERVDDDLLLLLRAIVPSCLSAPRSRRHRSCLEVLCRENARGGASRTLSRSSCSSMPPIWLAARMTACSAAASAPAVAATSRTRAKMKRRPSPNTAQCKAIVLCHSPGDVGDSVCFVCAENALWRITHRINNRFHRHHGESWMVPHM